MKKLFCFIAIMFFLNFAYGQDIKKANTKMDAFVSKTGVLIKFIDYDLSDVHTTYKTAEAKVRKLISGGEIGYFYQISFESKYDTKKASIAYEDLVEVIKALDQLKIDSNSDKLLNSGYLENKFVTDDGFQVGYYVSEGKLKWYMVLEKYGSGNTIFLNDVSNVERAFNEAKIKIESMK